jgi:hypothetical protein
MRWTEVPMPEGYNSDNGNSRDAVKRAVKKDLEQGRNIEYYKGRRLAVVGYIDSFLFDAEVKEEIVRVVRVTEVEE